MTYETVSRIAQQGGSVYFVLLFVIGVIYAVWPRKAAEFQRASRLPLDEEA
jgi:cytochrome c oxidase cbb3-type subunit 4